MSLIDDIEIVLTKYWKIGCFEHVNGRSELSPIEVWAKLRRRAHRFSFDPTVAFEQVHIDLAQNMIERRIFRLPYPAVIYEFSSRFAYEEGEDAKPARELVMIADVRELPHATLIGQEHEPAHTKFVMMGGFTIKGGSANGYTSILSPAVVRLSPSGAQGGPIFQIARVSNGHPSDADIAELRQEMWGNTLKAVSYALSCTTLLMSKSVETRAEPAPEKLNRSREKKGKLPIPPTTVVKLKLGAIQGPRLDLGGAHASPRIHYRAGHFRILHRGSPQQREVPVASAIVGRGEYGDLVKKDYLVTQVDKEARDEP
jgi:hypothetical protein